MRGKWSHHGWGHRKYDWYCREVRQESARSLGKKGLGKYKKEEGIEKIKEKKRKQ